MEKGKIKTCPCCNGNSDFEYKEYNPADQTGDDGMGWVRCESCGLELFGDRESTIERWNRRGASPSCYIVVWEDRHADTEVYVFLDEATAIAWAKKNARDNDKYGDLDEELNPAMISAGWLYYGCYSCEGDNIRVVKTIADYEC